MPWPIAVGSGVPSQNAGERAIQWAIFRLRTPWVRPVLTDLERVETDSPLWEVGHADLGVSFHDAPN